MAFIIRLRSSKAMHRMMFDDAKKTTLAHLKAQVKHFTGIESEHQLLSRTPLAPQPDYITADDSTTLQKLALNHGDILYVVDLSGHQQQAAADSKASSTASATTSSSSSSSSTSSTSSSTSTPTAPPKLTKHCQHGPNGRCLHCDAAPRGVAPTGGFGKCMHGPNGSCANCLPKVTNDDKTVSSVLQCNHSANMFCPRCIPPTESGPTSTDIDPDTGLTKLCQHGPGTKCVYCLSALLCRPELKSNFLPYAYYIEKNKGRGVPEPTLPSFTGKPNCSNGHKPWPYGVCLSCAPPNANLRVQPYRHCDYVQSENIRLAHATGTLSLLEYFYSKSRQDCGKMERAGILFGTYFSADMKSAVPGAVTAHVSAIYVPPQTADKKIPVGGIRFFPDKNEAHVHQIANALGLQPVGWVIYTQPRVGGDKYGGDVFLTGSEVRQAARFQNLYKDAIGHSKFVTVLLPASNNVVPAAYQVSDQCVALERDGLLEDSKDSFMLTNRVPKPNELLPKINFKDRPLEPGEEFIFDEFIVRLVTLHSKTTKSTFVHHEFPSNGLTRDMTAEDLKALLATHLSDFKNEDYKDKLSDFNLLTSFPRIFKKNGLELALKIAEALSSKQPFPATLKSTIDDALLRENLI